MSHYDIPDHFFEPKPFYRDRPAAEAVLREIKDHIKKTGEPHTWRHHTHSKPVQNARIVYIGTFDLPKSHQAPDRHAPCPCCSPRAPKYSRKGMIAWFPDEHVIRMIGPECFQTLNPDGHWEAVETFDREEGARRTIDYLVGNLHLSGKSIEVLQNALPTLTAIDEVHATLRSRLTDIVRVDLWRHVGRGSLKVHVMSRRLRRGPAPKRWKILWTSGSLPNSPAIKCLAQRLHDLQAEQQAAAHVLASSILVRSCRCVSWK
jgi:hypothetical protein